MNLSITENPIISSTRSGHVTVSVDAGVGATSEKCPLCGTTIYTNNSLSLDSHLILDCRARSDNVSREIKRRVKEAQVADLDPLLVLKLEIDSVVTQPSHSDGHLEDSRYLFLPKNFSNSILYTSTVGEQSSVFEKFQAWCDYIERTHSDPDLCEIIHDFEEKFVSLKTSTALNNHSSQENKFDSTMAEPEKSVLMNLETELGFGASGCPRDVEMTLLQLGLSV